MKKGDTISFGNYPYTAEGEQRAIEWTVMQMFDGVALLLSREAVDAQPMFAKGATDGTYEQSWLSQWLNGEFLQKAFTEGERSLIAEAADSTRVGKGLGRVFIPSLHDINDADLFPTDLSTGCTATPYAKSRYDDYMERERQEEENRPYGECASWWLRDRSMAVWGGTVGSEGVVFMTFGLDQPLAVRPALLLNVEAYEQMNKQCLLRRLLGALFGTGCKDKRSGEVTYTALESVDVTLTKEIEGKSSTKNMGKVLLISRPTSKQGGKMVFLPRGVKQQPQVLVTKPGLASDHMMPLMSLFGSACVGQAEMQMTLASLYWHGHEVPQDYAESVRWDRYAANQGNAAAMLDLAECHNKGLGGLECDDKKAFELCKKAAETGFPRAMKNLALCYSSGIGTEQDEKQSEYWLKKYEEAQTDEEMSDS